MKPNNPFLIAGYYSPDYFCDRDKETSELISALSNGRNVTLIAPRRIGKTGLIHHVFNQIKEQDSQSVTLYMDIYSTQSLSDFVKLLANTVLGQLDSSAQKALKRIGQIITSCRPILTFDELTGMPKVSIDVAKNSEEVTLKEIFQYIASSDRRCYIAIDEFQQIAEYPEKGTEALLRSYVQFLPNVNFIFAGSKQHVMQDMFMKSKRPFYQSTQLLNIDVINREQYFDFAVRHFSNGGFQLPTEVFSEIYDRFGGYTWYVQCLLNRLYSYHRDVNLLDINSAADQIISEQNYFYADLLKSYPSGCVRLLKAIAQEGHVREIFSGDFISKYNLRAVSSVSSSLKKLTGNELVYETSEGYVVYDRFMAEWLRKFTF